MYLYLNVVLYNFSFHNVGVIVLLLHYISGFAKHAVKLIDFTEKDEDSKKVQREKYLTRSRPCNAKNYIS